MDGCTSNIYIPGENFFDGEFDLDVFGPGIPFRALAYFKPSKVNLSGKSPSILDHIVHLDLSKNCLCSLPSNFGDLYLLKDLNLIIRNNLLTPTLAEVACPSLTREQCEACAETVVGFILKQSCTLESGGSVDFRGMAEKAAGKKEQQKNKKSKQHEKKKNQENGLKHHNEVPLNLPNYLVQKKKNKGNKNSNNFVSGNFIKPSKKKPGSNEKSFIALLFTRAFYIILVVGFIYIVDYEKFIKIRDGASYCVNKTVSLLPPEVVSKGKEAVGYVQPYAEIGVKKLNCFINETSTFFNTNPLVKDHWANIREIGSICSARLVDYMRTLYLQITGYCHDVKNKFFQ